MIPLLLAPLVVSAELSVPPSMPLPAVAATADGLVCENGVCYRTAPSSPESVPQAMPGPGATTQPVTATGPLRTTTETGVRRFRPLRRLLGVVQNRPRLFGGGCN